MSGYPDVGRSNTFANRGHSAGGDRLDGCGMAGGLVRAGALAVAQSWVLVNLPRILAHRAREHRAAAYL